MNKFESCSGRLTWFIALLLSALLSGCSGGGGGGGPMTTVSGTAATGAPISGGKAQMVCAGSIAGAEATTGADGNFTVTAPAAAPCVIRVSGGTGNVGGTLFSIVASAGQARANVNQLTNMLAWLLAGGNPDTGLFQSPNSISSKVTAGAVATHTATINANVTANLGAAVGISTSFDFLAGTFTANGGGFDQLLDNVSFTLVGTTPTIVLKSTGVTLLAVNPATGAATTTSSTVIGATALAAVPGAVLPGAAGSVGAAAANPTAISSNPSTGATNVPTRTNSTGNVLSATLLSATFNEAMLASSLTTVGVFTLKETTSGTNVAGSVTMNAANTVATFKPTVANLTPNTSYTATISTAAKTAGGTAIASTIGWKFTTNSVALVGQAPIDLLTAGNFVILTKTGITNTGTHTTAITGDIGSSPITAAAMNNVFCSEITGKIYGVDAAYVGSGAVTCFAGNPPAANKTLVDNAVADMGTAFAEAAGRALPDGTELFAGNLGGRTFTPGLYKWSTAVTIPTDVTLSGDKNAVWIFQIAGNLDISSGGSVPAGIKVILSGGAKASNVFWQVDGLTGATLGTYSTFNGTILSSKQVIVQTGAVLNGRALAQTQVTLDANPVTKP